VQKLNSVSLAILELLALNAQKFTWSRDRGHAPFRNNFGSQRSVSALPLKMRYVGSNLMEKQGKNRR